jgi:cytochrome c-type biogenesis protein CcmE
LRENLIDIRMDLRQLPITRSLTNRMGTRDGAKLVCEAGPQGTAYERGAHCPAAARKRTKRHFASDAGVKCRQARAKEFGGRAMTRKQRRFSLIGAALGILALAVALVLSALKDSIVFFNTPTDVVEKQVKPGTRLRIGGLVKEGSVLRGDGLAVRFEVTDGKRTVPVAYRGLLPDLFREGQSVIAEGALDPGGIFRADSVLAKHDETYMPKDVADALKRQGHWKDDYEKKLGAAPRGTAQ